MPRRKEDIEGNYQYSAAGEPLRLTPAANTSIIEVLQKGSNLSLDRQAGQLLGNLDTLFQRFMMGPLSGNGPQTRAMHARAIPAKAMNPKMTACSREEIRAIMLIGATVRMSMSALAESLGVPLSTATHTVDRLVRKRLVDRIRTEADRRIVQVEMSAHGRKLGEMFRAQRRVMARSWLVPLSPKEREVFLKLMSKITEEPKS